MLRNTNKYKWGQIWGMGKAWMWQVPYFQGGAIPRNSNCPFVANMTLEDTFWEVAHTPK